MEIKRVLCPTDFSRVSELGVELATRIAARSGARLTLQHNFEPIPALAIAGLEALPQSVVDLEKEREDEAEQHLNKLLESIPKEIGADARLTTGQAHASILALARALPADLIVMGTHGRSGLGHLFIGSVTERVLGAAPCPVLTMRSAGEPSGFEWLFSEPGAANQTVLVPIDFSPHSLYTLEYAFRLVDLLPVSLTLLHVLEPASVDDLRSATHFNVPEYLRLRKREIRDRLRGLIPANLERHTEVAATMGLPVEEIPRFAERIKARLVVMGCRPKGLLAELLGTTSKGVLRASPCPVWVVPPHVAGSISHRAAETVAAVH